MGTDRTDEYDDETIRRDGKLLLDIEHKIIYEKGVHSPLLISHYITNRGGRSQGLLPTSVVELAPNG